MKINVVVTVSLRKCFHSQHQIFRMILYLDVCVVLEVSNNLIVITAMTVHLLINQLIFTTNLWSCLPTSKVILT